jgi:hypothetical protein
MPVTTDPAILNLASEIISAYTAHNKAAPI